MQFITYDEYQQYSNLKKPNLDESTKLAIDAANAFVTKWLNWDNEDGEVINVIPTRNTYFLDNIGTTGIISILRLDNPIQIVDPTSYYFKSPGILIFTRIPPRGAYIVNITPSSETNETISHDLKQAVILLVEYWIKADYRSSKSFGGETVQFTTQETGMPKHIRAILELYRNI